MNKWFWLMALLSALLVSLAPAVAQEIQNEQPDSSTNHAASTASRPVSAHRTVLIPADDFSFSIQRPKGWRAMPSDYGLLLFERDTIRSASGMMNDGLIVHLFVPPPEYLSDFTPIDPGLQNSALAMLRYVRYEGDHVGDAAISDPVAFEWSGVEAAYYLLNNGDGNVTVVFALEIPDSRQLLVCNVTAPAHEAGRLRSLLPGLLGTLAIDGEQLDGAVLELLPDPLTFPTWIDDRAQINPILDRTDVLSGENNQP